MTLVLLPILYTVVEAASVDFRDAVDLLFRPLVGTLLFNTVLLVIAASLASAVIGTAAAWVVERTDLPGRNVWSALIAAPLAIPPFVTSYAWVSMSNALQDFAGALLVVTCAYYPLVYLPVAAALRGLDPALEETARSLGESAWGCFLRVVLPQLRPALLGGVLLVALDTLTEFGAFALLRFRTFTTELYAQYRTGLAGPESSLLALVLVALCLALLFAEFRVRGDARYARVGAGARRSGAPAPLGWARLPVLAALGALAVATLGVPIGMIGYLALPACASRDLARRADGARSSSARRSILWATGCSALRPRSCLRRRSAISRSASRAGGPRSSSAPPIWRRACPGLSSRWRSFR